MASSDISISEPDACQHMLTRPNLEYWSSNW